MARFSSFVRLVVSGSVLSAAACGSETNPGDDNAGGAGNQPAGGTAGAQTGGGTGGAGAAGGSPQGGTGLGGGAGAAGSAGATSGAPGGGTAGASGGGGGPGGAGAGGGASGAGSGGAAGNGGTAGAGGSASGTAGAGSGGVGGKGGAGGAGAGGKAGSGVGGAAGSGGAAGCMTPPAPSPLVGWATVNEMSQNGTTGGGTTAPVVVTSTAAFNTNAAGTAPRVIHVSGNLSGNFTIGSNKTVVGVCGATLQGHVQISNSVNVILRNLRVVGNNCTDSPQQCSGGADAISITSNSHHIWVDHLDVSDGSDGNLDVNAGSDLVTISWTKFSYSTRRTDPVQGASGHRFSNLVGSGDAVTGDVGHLRVTFHHNWWAQNIDQRMPRTRFGNIHVFNNLYTATGNSYCTNAGIQTHLLVENNAYVGVNNPLAPDANGDMLARGNLFSGTTPANPTANGTGFTPPYQYMLDPTSNLQATIQGQAGPR